MANWNRMKFHISASCCILSQPQLIFLNFIVRWEFYPFLPQKACRVNPFWFQQDEFYRLRKSCNKPIYAFQFPKDRIILFYIPAGRYKMQWQKFQFPTGWNSTLLPRSRQEQRHVSIPNGMEFYAFKTHIKERYPSFNSQRDGILLFSSYILTSKTASFNSQRDGILH